MTNILLFLVTTTIFGFAKNFSAQAPKCPSAYMGYIISYNI